MNRATLVTALVATQVLFGSLAIAGKIAFETLEPATIALVRIAGGAIFLLAVAHGVMRLPLPKLRDLPVLAALALLGVVLNQVLYLEGLDRTSAVGATLMQATIPLWTGTLALAFQQERARTARLAGLALGFLGILVLVASRGDGLGSPAGNALIATNALCYAGFLVLGRRVVPRLGPVLVFAWAFALGALMVLPYSVPTALAEDWAAVPSRVWYALAYILFAATIIAHGINVIALKYTQSSTVAGLIYLQPVVGAALAVALLGEKPGVLALVAATLVLGGVTLVARAARADAREPAREATVVEVDA